MLLCKNQVVIALTNSLVNGLYLYSAFIFLMITQSALQNTVLHSHTYIHVVLLCSTVSMGRHNLGVKVNTLKIVEKPNNEQALWWLWREMDSLFLNCLSFDSSLLWFVN